ncbi:MAG: metallophosphoesterase [Candidatus Magasanikiibacteriota bacterium]
MQLFFDLLIAIIIIITAFPAVILLYSRKYRKNSWEYKNKKSSLSFSIILLFITVITVYGSFIEPNFLIVNKHNIDLPSLEEPITIAFISDLQAGKYKQTDWTEKVVNKILTLKPHIVLIGGDQVDNEDYNLDELTYLEPLKKLSDQIPTYTVNGNHEYGISCFYGTDKRCSQAGDMSQETKSSLEKLGIKYLTNQTEKITVNSSSFYLFGGDEYWTKKLDFSSLKNRKETIPTIALIHNPSFILDEHPAFDLILSGHTHGGQIRLPFIGPIGRVDNILSSKYYQGLHELDDKTKLLVTSGAGETGVRARLFNPPEIVLITIK